MGGEIGWFGTVDQQQLVARTVHKGYVNCNDKRSKTIRISNNDNYMQLLTISVTHGVSKQT